MAYFLVGWIKLVVRVLGEMVAKFSTRNGSIIFFGMPINGLLEIFLSSSI